MYLFFDTETTGFINKQVSSTDPKQARVCQLGALLTDENGRTMGQFDLLIRPTNWIISEHLTKIHGISHSMAARYGVPIMEALEMFESFINKSEVLVAHNFEFDKNVLALERDASCVTESLFSTKRTCCTMLNATEVCKIPNATKGGYKWPKLQEIYQVLFDRQFDNAHNAMADVIACKEVFFEMLRRES